MAPTLDYLRSSPVRGQLEPYDPRTTKGWRYIQTTDTLNQLKVLLPPGTASMYEQLLKFEAFELRKKSGVSWERILQIRHLKDRMIRKCQRLAKTSPQAKPGDPFAFQTIVASADFRVKEMEKWFKEQQKRTNALLHRPHPHPQAIGPSLPPPHSCPKCISSRSPAVARSAALPGPSRRPAQNMPLKTIEDKQPTLQQPRSTPKPSPLPERSSMLPSQSKAESVVAASMQHFVSSPPPLPHLLRIRDLETGYDLSNDPQPIVSMPSNAPPLDPTPSGSPALSVDSSPSPPPPQEQQRPQLSRRRSCIKRSSTGDFAKTVSWADDRELVEQFSKYATVAREVQATSRKWEDIREVYVEQMQGLENLQSQVEQCMEQLRSESEQLQRADETIRRQRDILRSTFEDFEKRQQSFQAQVQEALVDTNNMLSLTGAKKDTSSKTHP